MRRIGELSIRERLQHEENRQNNAVEARNKSNKIIADRLIVLVNSGELDDPWERKFVRNVHNTLNNGFALSPQQEEILDRVNTRWN